MPSASKAAGPFVYIVGYSVLGQTLAAASPIGVCMLAFADSRSELIKDVVRRFPGAVPAPTRHPSMTWLRQAVKHVATPWEKLPFPIDLHGTPFQRKVWRALRRVPSGRTSSYQDIARALGAPTASRAVAGACGANPISIAVPCHRIVHRDGSLSGYRWGVERKQKLLALEAKHLARTAGTAR
jgi:AraC family transcriptional regulator of adaptative response/methylated-DNA-[protein]-cysteine methyltransferase